MKIENLIINEVQYQMVGECLVPSYLLETKSKSITSPEEALPFFTSLKGLKQETLQIITLDGNHQFIKNHTITIGIVNQSLAHPREIFRKAIEDNAVSIMMAHNHPSGNVKPSESDLNMTKRVSDSGNIIGIALLDSLIVTASDCYSICENHPNLFNYSYNPFK